MTEGEWENAGQGWQGSSGNLNDGVGRNQDETLFASKNKKRSRDY